MLGTVNSEEPRMLPNQPATIPGNVNPDKQTTWPWLIAATLLALLGVLIVCTGGMGVQPAPILARFGPLALVIIEQSLLVLPWLAAALGYGFGVRQILTKLHTPWTIGLSGQLAIGAALFCLVGWIVSLITTSPTAAWAVGVGGWALVVWQTHLADSTKWASNIKRPAWPALLASIAAGLLIGCTTLAPLTLWEELNNGYIALLHHLQIPREWAHLGSMQPLEHNAYSFLPNLLEVAYMQLALWRGDAFSAAYGAQLLHASFAIIAATQIAHLVSRLTDSRIAASAAAAVYIATPWTLMTGALALTDQATAALAAVSLNLIITTAKPAKTHATHAALAGAAAGFAVLFKPEAALTVAIPLLLASLVNPSARIKRTLAFIIAAIAIISPWLIRNAMWTSNPFFPYFAESFGSAHWTTQQAQHWALDHSAGNLSPYLAIFTPFTDFRFAYILLPFAIITPFLVIKKLPKLAPQALTLIMILILQIITWAFTLTADTQLLIPTIVTAAVLTGLALHSFSAINTTKLAATLATIAIIVTGTILQANLYINQQEGYAPEQIEAIETTTIINPNETGVETNIFHVANLELPTSTEDKIYTEGIVTPFYFADIANVYYHSPYDHSPIGPALQARGGPGAHTWLSENNYRILILDTYWINKHLSTSYRLNPAIQAYDTNIDPQSIQALISAFSPRNVTPRQTIYEIPPRQ